MKKTLLALTVCGLICSLTGCASGPLSQWFRGAPCNSCNPPISQPGAGLNLAPPCGSGCGSTDNTTRRGLFDWLRPQQNTGPGSSFPTDPGVQYYGDPGIPQLEISPGPIGAGVVPQTQNYIPQVQDAFSQGQIAPQVGGFEGSIAPGSSFLPTEIQSQIAPLTPTSGELYGSGIRSGIPPAIGPDPSGL